jgi:DnaJ-class molecular chaperone
MLRMNYYLMLGVPCNESKEGVRQAFREIVKRYHPDRVTSERLGFFQQIVEAYHVLADPERRRDYDRELDHSDEYAAAPTVSMQASIHNLPRPISVLRAVGLKDAPFQAALARVSGSVTAAEIVSKEYCEGLNTAVILSPHEAVQGGALFLAVPSCSPCEKCGGSGTEGMFPCSRCDGEGLCEEQETVRVYVPPMVADGTVMEIPLRGLGIHNFYLRLNIRIGL